MTIIAATVAAALVYIGFILVVQHLNARVIISDETARTVSAALCGDSDAQQYVDIHALDGLVPVEGRTYEQWLYANRGRIEVRRG